MSRNDRKYQEEAVAELQQGFRKHRCLCFVLPTGGGKTRVAVRMIRGLRVGRALVLAHRIELIDQMVAALEADEMDPKAIGVIMADDSRTNPTATVQVASVQTIARRRKKKDAIEDVTLIVVDEAHHAAAESYKAILARYPNAKVLGLSATPVRLDGCGLKDSFDALVHGPVFSKLEAEGWVVAPRVFSKRGELPDVRGVKLTGGDYNNKALAKVMNKRALVGDIVEHWKKHAANRRTVAFAVNREHARKICAQFVAAGIACEYVDALTSPKERKAIQDRLRKGTTRVVVNCEIFCEGWDMPEVKCAILARPTRSLVLYNQQAGRILRPYDEDGMPVRPLILDHAGNWTRFGLPHADRTFELDPPRRTRKVDAAEAPCKACPSCEAVVLAGVMACGECGHEWEAAEVREVGGDLREVNPMDPTFLQREWDRVLQAARQIGKGEDFARRWFEATVGARAERAA